MGRRGRTAQRRAGFAGEAAKAMPTSRLVEVIPPTECRQADWGCAQ